jgi:hypothetical protein
MSTRVDVPGEGPGDAQPSGSRSALPQSRGHRIQPTSRHGLRAAHRGLSEDSPWSSWGKPAAVCSSSDAVEATTSSTSSRSWSTPYLLPDLTTRHPAPPERVKHQWSVAGLRPKARKAERWCTGDSALPPWANASEGYPSAERTMAHRRTRGPGARSPEPAPI